MKHQKHSKIAKPDVGYWGRAEWAILGTVCEQIQALAQALKGYLAPNWRIAYVDADHKTADEPDSSLPFEVEWTDKISFQQLQFAQKPNAWEQRALFNDMDVVLVNGNHFEASRQLVALDRRKFDSLSRKLDRLTQVDLFLVNSRDPNFAPITELPDFLKNHLPQWKQVPVADIANPAQIAVLLADYIPRPPLKALILTGGKSTRMGTDKAAMHYHGLPQWQYLQGMLQIKGLDVFISCREDQADLFSGEQIIPDSFIGLGPMGAILSAFRHEPNAAWLVLACDLPLFDASTLDYLIKNRETASIATAFRQVADLPELSNSPNKGDGFPEPLVTIWEPKSYAHLLNFLAQGISCPRKVLINSNTHLLDAPNPEALTNANTPEERAVILQKYL